MADTSDKGEGNTIFHPPCGAKSHELPANMYRKCFVWHSVPSPAISRPIKSLDKIIVIYRHDRCLGVQKNYAHMLIFLSTVVLPCVFKWP